MAEQPTAVSYAGQHAAYYDLIYGAKDYRSEASFVHQLLVRFGAGPGTRMLELACGTGSHALEFSGLGYDVTATDYSESMLRVARAKTSGQSRPIGFHKLDMRELAAFEGSFGAIVCLFDSIGYVQTNEALMRVLAGVRSKLADGGLFVFEFWHAAAMLRSFEPTRVRRFALPEGELLRITETRLETSRQLATVAYELIELRNDGGFSRVREVQVNRFFLLQEMASYLVANHLELLAAHAGFSAAGVIDETTWHIVAVARAA